MRMQAHIAARCTGSRRIAGLALAVLLTAAPAAAQGGLAADMLDLSVREVAPLGQVRLADWGAFGVRAAHLGELGNVPGLPRGAVPAGFAVPLSFYVDFMTANGLYDEVRAMLADPDFQADYDVQRDRLKDLRKMIRKAETPEWILHSLTVMHEAFPPDRALRYRASANDEMLVGAVDGALYDSRTQQPKETRKDGIDKSLKQVYASVWSFEAFAEREFGGVDHFAVGVGALVHPNFEDELGNGVAVSFGEYVIHAAISSRSPLGDGPIEETVGGLRRHLAAVHSHFEDLYAPAPGAPFAMELDFKVTSEGELVINDARPRGTAASAKVGVDSPDCPDKPCRLIALHAE